MSAEYLLSVDLGTSHTVAVVVWPDGRTRPLLFDGSPVMPSAVFLDEAGTIHVGRDAERLGPTVPERFEPNPKQRIAGGTLLLGDREINVTAAFAAILTRVARQCVEAIGGLPKTVLTCPASWSEQRRGALHDAAAQAGYAPVQIVTEPVAAAHYYAARMSGPIEPGQALAVFDFGGGTLDIALVERVRDGSFTVLADGGLHDLGGLDFDAALVAHIGETVKQRDPDLWKRLEQPGSATELRDRRTLWDDVRGAKEMLSRSSVAPVTVPGLEQALHLTRGELDQLARPLLSRAVGETQRVVSLTGRSPEQLTGLFLVGGSSRMPLVAKVLHEELGIAPAVLEQPELPVSEGAAVAVTGPAPVTPPAMASPPASPPQQTSPQQTSPHTGSLPPRTPPEDATLGLQMPGQDRERKRKRAKIIALVAVLALLAVAGPLVWLYFTNPYKQRPFTELEEVGDTVAYAGEPGLSLFEVRTRGDRALFAYTTGSGESERLHLQALSTQDGRELWDGEQVLEGDGWDDNFYVSDELIAFRQEVYDDIASEYTYTWYFVDWSSGDILGDVDNGIDTAKRNGDHLAFLDGNTIQVYDSSGNEAASWSTGSGDDAPSISDWGPVESQEDLTSGYATLSGDGRFWSVDSDGAVHLHDIESGDVTDFDPVETPDSRYYAYNGVMYVAVDSDTGYTINAYDLESNLDSLGWFRVRNPGDDVELDVEWIEMCGEQRVCIAESNDGDTTDGYTFSVFDAEEGEVVHAFDEGKYSDIKAVGDGYLAEIYEGDDNLVTQVYDKDFETVGERKSETYSAIDGGSALSWPSSGVTDPGPVIGLGARDGVRETLRDSLAANSCGPSDIYLACFIEEGMQIYRFRDE